MYDLYPYFTNDGSVGLFSPEADDIYHSTYGALSEAYEKFILPANLEKYFETHKEIKVLDICYGIGYNTKSFLNFLIEKNILKINFQKNNLKKSNNIDTIHTNNISCALNNLSIHSNNNCKTNNDIMFNKVMHDNTISIDTVHSNNALHKNSSCNDEEVKILSKY